MNDLQRKKWLDLRNCRRTMDPVERAWIISLNPNRPMPYGVWDAEWLDALHWLYVMDNEGRKGRACRYRDRQRALEKAKKV